MMRSRPKAPQQVLQSAIARGQPRLHIIVPIRSPGGSTRHPLNGPTTRSTPTSNPTRRKTEVFLGRLRLHVLRLADYSQVDVQSLLYRLVNFEATGTAAGYLGRIQGSTNSV